jgi:GNAT superfamily N-acetyltransferase
LTPFPLPAPLPALTVQRLEAAEATLARAVAFGQGTPALGGFAAFVSASSPLTHVVGAGVDGSITEAELRGVEEFYTSREADTVFELSPLADPILFELLQTRGYRMAQFENTLVLNLTAPPATPATPIATVRRIEAHEHKMWARLAAQAFFSREEVSAEEQAIGEPFAAVTHAYVAEIEGRPVATASLWVHDEIAFFLTDATLPAYRGRGLQQALIQRRLQDSVAEGARYATAGTGVNSLSQTNYLRQGFRVLYTKITMRREADRIQ